MGKNRTLKRTQLIGLAVITVLAVVGFASPESRAQDMTPHVEVYGFVQADYIQDFNRVDNAWKDTLRPSKIPTVEGLFGDDGQASISAKQSRLGVLMNFPTANKPVYTKFEFDMFGVGVDEGQTTIRLRHAYGQWGPWLGGQTNTLFMDASIFPNVIDYWGPAGMVFIRNPQIRWTPVSNEDMSFAVAIERPSNDVDAGQIREFDPGLGDDIQGTNRLPDLTAQYRYQDDWGHFQIAGVVRKVSFETLDTPGNEPSDSEIGWGVDGTGSFKFLAKDKIIAGVVYGEGIASYMNDGGMDMAPETSGLGAEAATVPLLGVSAYWDHWWSEKFSSSFGYSETAVQNTDLQTDDAFHRGQYASANLLWYPTNNVFIGAEYLWGRRVDNNGDKGDDNRVQISMHFSFSTKDIFKKAEQ